jgi:hypothetical protein
MIADFRSMKHLLLSLSLLTAFVRAESPEKSIDLLNGKDLAAWQLITQPTTPAELATVCKYNVVGSLAAAGKIGIQLEGTPFELRNLRLAPLK